MPAKISDVASAMVPSRNSDRIKTPMLEELSQLEMELPARRWPPLIINLVEPIPDIHTQRSEWAQRRNSKAEAAEKPRRIELTGLVPNVAALEEAIQAERLIDPEAELPGADEEGVAERRPAGLRLVRLRIEPVRRDRELVVAAKLLAILGAAHRESL